MTPVFGTQITPERWQYEHSFSPWAWNDKRSIRLLNDRRYSCYMLPFFTLSENELASLLCNIQKKGKLKESLFYIGMNLPIWRIMSKSNEKSILFGNMLQMLGF